jgi:hypothetical protein
LFNYLDFHKACRLYLSKIRGHTSQELGRLDEEDKKQLRSATEVFNHSPRVYDEGEEGMVDIAYTLLELLRRWDKVPGATKPLLKMVVAVTETMNVKGMA